MNFRECSFLRSENNFGKRKNIRGDSYSQKIRRFVKAVTKCLRGLSEQYRVCLPSLY